MAKTKPAQITAPVDAFAWLDGGLQLTEPVVSIAPPTKGRTRRKGIRRLEDENRWPEYLEWIGSGRLRADYARAVGVSLSTLYRWEKLTDADTEAGAANERQAQITEAYAEAAHVMVSRAERVLRTAVPDKDMIARADKLAAHYRWQAERMNAIYGQRAESGDGGEFVLKIVRRRLPTVAEQKAEQALLDDQADQDNQADQDEQAEQGYKSSDPVAGLGLARNGS